MKKIFKIFNLLLLLFTVAQSCLAVNDCRFIRNNTILELIKRHFEHYEVAETYLPHKKVHFSYAETIFMMNIDAENVNEVTATVPVLNSSLNTALGETVISITIKKNITFDEILNILTSNSNIDINTLEFRIDSAPIFFKSGANINRYTSTENLVIILRSFINLKLPKDRIFYMMPADTLDKNLNNIRLVCETTEGNTVIDSVFQNPSTGRFQKPKLVNNTPNQSFLGGFLGLFTRNKPVHRTNWGYMKLKND
jgi:hypothetical protein